jgi:hypothetical protein
MLLGWCREALPESTMPAKTLGRKYHVAIEPDVTKAATLARVSEFLIMNTDGDQPPLRSTWSTLARNRLRLNLNPETRRDHCTEYFRNNHRTRFGTAKKARTFSLSRQ